MQIETVVLTGVASDQCVLATAIVAAERGFHVIIATDAVANLDAGSAEATQFLFGRVWRYVMSTDGIIHWMTTGQKPSVPMWLLLIIISAHADVKRFKCRQ